MARETTGVLGVSWDFAPARKMAAGIRADTRRADRPIRQAHDKSAFLLQQQMAGKLIDALKKRGRAQDRGNMLIDAIMSEDNAVVDVSGFSVGYLDQFDKVRLYYRNLEEGTAIFVGRTIHGIFIGEDGLPSAPAKRKRRKGRDNVIPYNGQQRLPPAGLEGGLVNGAAGGGGGTAGENNRDPRFASYLISRTGRPAPALVITHQITGYHYIEDGFLAWREKYRPLNIALYRYYMKEAGLDNLDRLLAPLGSDAYEALLPQVSIRFT